MERPIRLNLNATNTPLDQASRLTDHLTSKFNTQIFIKRDDMCAASSAPFPSGKTRKLEYIMAEALNQRATTLIVSGNCQSNHARQLAYLAWKFQLSCHCVYQNDTPWDTRIENYFGGNAQLASLYGAKCHYVEDANEYIPRLKESLEFKGERVYVSTRGGSNSVGDLGYMHCFEEIKQELFSTYGFDEATIFVCSGSGGTHAGLALAAHLYGKGRFKVVGVPNKRTATEQFVEVQKSVQNLQRLLHMEEQTLFLNMETVDIPYGKVTSEVVDFTRFFFDQTGLILDPTYSVKPALSMVELVKDNRVEGPVVFVNGGCPVNLFINPQEYKV